MAKTYQVGSFETPAIDTNFASQYRVRTLEYFKFPNLEGAMVWEKTYKYGGAEKMRKNIFKKIRKIQILMLKIIKLILKNFMI